MNVRGSDVFFSVVHKICCKFMNSFQSCSRKRFEYTRPFWKVFSNRSFAMKAQIAIKSRRKRRFAHVGIIVFSDDRGWSNEHARNRHVRLQQHETSKQQRIKWLIRAYNHPQIVVSLSHDTFLVYFNDIPIGRVHMMKK